MIWKKIKYYNLIPLLILGLILFLIKDILVDILNKSPDFRLSDKLNKMIVYYGSMISWCYITFVTLRNKRYKLLTGGRYYPKDRSAFHKTYSYLINFFCHNDKYKMDINKLPIEDWHNADGVILCKYRDLLGNYRLVKRSSGADGNLITFGLPGSGKSTTQAATSALRFNAKQGGCGVFAISIKGDLLNFVRGKRQHIKVFTPDKADGSCHYDPLDGLEKMSPTEQRTRIESISMIICPDEEGENAAFFVTGARDYFCSMTHYLLYLHNNAGILPGRLTFHEIIDKILYSNVFKVTLAIQESGCKIAGEYTNSYIGSSEKNVSGIYNHLCKSVRPFNNGALRELLDGEGECISPEDLSSGDVYIDVPQDKYQVYSPIISIIISNFLMEFMRRDDVSSQKKVTPILFLLDEVFQLQIPYQVLSQAMSTLRSKKISLFLLGQSIFQIKERYGDAQMHEIIDLCGYISLFNEQDPEGREYFQKLVGHRKMLKKSTSLSQGSDNRIHSSGISVSIEDEYIFDSEKFGNLSTWDKQRHKSIKRVLVYANGKYILGETTPCYE